MYINDYCIDTLLISGGTSIECHLQQSVYMSYVMQIYKTN